jgi:hypothetical protein
MPKFERRWTDAMDAELLDRVEAGETFAAAGIAMGVTKNAAIGRYNRLSGYSKRKTKRALSKTFGKTFGKTWGLTLCAELPIGLTEYVPVNPRAGKRPWT